MIFYIIYIIYIIALLVYTFLCIRGMATEAILLILPLILVAILLKDKGGD